MMGDVILRLWAIAQELLGVLRRRTGENVTVTVTITVGDVTATLYKSDAVPLPSDN